MGEIAYMCTKANMTPDAVLNMDIGLFLGLRKEFYIFDLEKTKEGREALNDAILSDPNNNIDRYNTKKADIDKVKLFISKQK